MTQEQLHDQQNTLEGAPAGEPIAIVGIGCRFPGARNADEFWHLLCTGTDAITDIPAERLDVEHLYDARPATPGKMITRWGGFLKHIDSFDYSFFGITPREAMYTDPQHRLLLEVAWEALEDAGEVPDALAGSQAGVFIGEIYNDYEGIQISDQKSINIYSITGSTRSIASGRLAYTLDLRGPSLTVDTACSSSLVAVHLACQSLWRGESPLALAGGVNLILQPEFSIGFSQARMLSPDGRCKAFDASANGFVRSEGAGIVVLKPLSQALTDGNPIYAVIRGSAVTNDGRSSGLLMTPGREGQEQALRNAYANAGIAPSQVQYVEAHGTGTSAGDPVEIAALAAVLSEGREPGHPCLVGSVKTNIGHTEGAAGIAGLIKTALCLKHRTIPPSLHCNNPNPQIPWQTLPLTVQRTLTPWPETAEPAIAGVSAFGISGTNAHIVLEEAPASVQRTSTETATEPSTHVLTLSAHTPEALRSMAQNWRDFLATAENNPTNLHDICYTASARRTHHDHRLAVVAQSHQEASQHLEAFLNGTTSPMIASGRTIPGTSHKVAFVFPGQGSQWIGMGRSLLKQEPVFRQALEQCEQAMKPYVDWSLIDILMGNDDNERMQEIACIQPTIFAIQVALAALWHSWGITPDAVVGHSMGEVAAAHVAGILSLEDAARIICRRSALLMRVRGMGAMAVTGLSLEQAQQYIAGFEDRLSIAVNNSPTTTVLSGDPKALEEIMATLQKQDIFCRPVKVDVASHSPQMDPLLEELGQVLKDIHPQAATIPLYSTVTGTLVQGTECDAAYWVRNLREPVLFSAMTQQLLHDQHTIFIEISPHPILLSAIQQSLQQWQKQATLLASLRRDEDERTMLLTALGVLYTLGLPIAWQQLYPTGSTCVRLPGYPWQRERCWSQPSQHTKHLQAGRTLPNGRTAHPLLQQYIRPATATGNHYWETALDSETFTYLADHCVQETIVFPAAAYVEMAQAAAIEAFDIASPRLEELHFHKALFLSQDHPQKLQLVFVPRNVDTVAFQFYTFSTDEDAPQLHASGTLNLHTVATNTLDEPILPETIQQRCNEHIDQASHYQAMQQRGLAYGPSFQGVADIWRRDGEALAQLHPVSQLVAEGTAYYIHPALLDACFQVLATAFPTQDTTIAATDTYLPVGLRSFFLEKAATGELWSYARLQVLTTENADILEGDIFLLEPDGHIVGAAQGLRFQRINQVTQPQTSQNIDEWLYKIIWEQMDAKVLSERTSPHNQPTNWLILSDTSGIGDQLTSQLKARGDRCIRVYAGPSYQRISAEHYSVPGTSALAFQQLLQDVSKEGLASPYSIVHLWSLDIPTDDTMQHDTLIAAQDPSCTSLLSLIQAMSKREEEASPHLFLVTRGAQSVDASEQKLSPAQAPIWGMGRVIFHEHPHFACRLIDLSPDTATDVTGDLLRELLSGAQEEQVALRNGQRYVARLVPFAQSASPAAEKEQPCITVDADHPFRVEIASPGVLDNLSLQETTRRKPGPGEVEIQVQAAGLNFRDVMVAMGIHVGQAAGPAPLGLECAGRVTALGDGVTDFQVGDEVIAISPFSFGSYVLAPTALVVPKPETMSFEQAATIPVAFLTAYYAISYLGRIRAGERILIHAATGGVGQAAVQLAQLYGAEVFATAGTPEKRAFLQSMGVHHVMDSRTLAFAEEVMALTQGQGVDLVLNSLAGEALLKSIETLGAYGRFLEIGKRDIYQNSQVGLRPFQNNLSFFAIDLDRMMRERPHILGDLFREVMQLFAENKLQPLPYKVFPVQEIASAFRYMAQAHHMGKIVIDIHQPSITITPMAQRTPGFRDDGTYLITGGLGGLGLEVTNWMIQQGARHLVLVGRREPSAEARAIIEKMRQQGADIQIMQADITQQQQLSDILHKIAENMPPLRGVIHGAAVLDDGIILQLDRTRLHNAMLPKILGAWHLHQLTKDMPLDFFILFSSVAAILGSPGQSNYCAGNTFLDTLAHMRRAQGLPALSINWGPWAEVGLAAAQANRGKRMGLRGVGSFTPEQGLEAMEYLFTQDTAQAAVMPFNAQQWCQFYPSASTQALLAHLLSTEASPVSKDKEQQNSIRQVLLSTPVEERHVRAEAYLSDRIAKVLGFTQTRIDTYQPLSRLGIDSLMAVELRNAIEADTGITIPVTHFLKGTNLHQLAQKICEQIAIEAETVSSEPAQVAQAAGTEQQEVAQLSEQEVDTLLQQLLETSTVEDLQQMMNQEEVQK